jgi:hypothetical protein
VDPFEAAFSFLPALPRAEAIVALRNRARQLEVHVARFREAIEGEQTDWTALKPPHVMWQFERVAVRLEAEIEWCHRTADRIEKGAGFHAHEQATEEMVARWRAAQ